MDVDTPEETLTAWLRLLHVSGLGPRTLARLLAAFGSPDAILAATDSAVAALGVPGAIRRELHHPDHRRIARDLRWLADSGCRLLVLGDPRYPAWLKACDDPPPALFALGRLEWLTTPCLAIVGSRNPTASGVAVARHLAADLVAAGLTIVSGLAAGIDGAAHHVALECGGATIAVAGNGLDRVYPARHRRLAERIAGEGLLLSEFPPGTPPLRGNFPRRNRVISGLSVGVLVVEAAARSGSLITARFAAEQGREVFAVPGAIANPLARGCHALIRDGAALVETAADVLRELGLPLVRAVGPGDRAPRSIAAGETVTAVAKIVAGGPVSVDTLVELTGYGAGDVAAALLALEIEGHVSSDPGGRYSLLPGSSG